MSPPIPESAELLRPYLPRMLLQWLADSPGTILREIDGTVVFVDISGFTKMSERLARKGKVGAEEVSEVLGRRLRTDCWRSPTATAAASSSSAATRCSCCSPATTITAKGARAAVGMRRTLREIGAIESSAGKITLRMSVGVHSGTFLFFLVGSSHRELIDHRARRQRDRATWRARRWRGRSSSAARPPPRFRRRCWASRKGDGVLLRSEPPGLVRGRRRRRCADHRRRPHRVRARGDPRAPARRRGGARAPSGDRRVHPLRRRRRAWSRREGPESVAVRAGRARHRGAERRRRARRHLPRHRHRPRRRQDHPGRRASPARWATTRSACSWRCAASMDTPLSIPIRIGVNRGPGLRGRHRPALPPHLHRDGRRREPRGPRHGEGRARADARDGARSWTPRP